MEGPACVAVVVDLDDFLVTCQHEGDGWARCATAAVDAVVRTECATVADAAVRTDPPDTWIVTIARTGTGGIAADAHMLALRLRDTIAEQTPTTASVAISRVVSGQAVAIRQARTTMAKKTLGGTGRVHPTTEHRRFEPPDITNEIVALLRSGATAGAVERVERWVGVMLRRQAEPDVVFGGWLPALILGVTTAVDPRRAPDGSPDWRSTLGHTPVAELAEVAGIHERSHLRGWLTGCLGRLARLATAARPSPLIERAEALMSAGYGDPELSLSSAAAELAVSPYHLAHVFRQERGTTFLRSLAGLRVRIGVGLLRRGLSVDEVGQRCGFSSTRQFRATLRRVTGQAPSRLRQPAGDPVQPPANPGTSLTMLPPSTNSASAAPSPANTTLPSAARMSMNGKSEP
jgi:AraC-like DNA-binding protein